MEGKPEVRYEEVPLNVVTIDEEWSRTLVDKDGLEELRRSIKERGVLVPVVLEETSDGYRVIAGTRRVLAADKAGLVKIPALIVKASVEWKAWAALTENVMREGMNAFDVGRWLTVVLERTRKSQAELALVLGVSESWISQRLAIINWPSDVQGALVQGVLSFAVAREIAAIGDQAERMMIMSSAAKSGCTVRQAVLWRKDWERRAGKREDLSVEDQAELERPKCDLCGEAEGERGRVIKQVCDQCLKNLRSVLGGNGQS